jgi:hypothetical protein
MRIGRAPLDEIHLSLVLDSPSSDASKKSKSGRIAGMLSRLMSKLRFQIPLVCGIHARKFGAGGRLGHA